MRVLQTIAYVLLVLLTLGCAAKDSPAHFAKRKYHIQEKAKPGRSNVTQRWWSHSWLGQRRSTKHRPDARPRYAPGQ